jgi:hypothetical protein
VSSDEASKPSDPEPSHDEPGLSPALPSSDPPIRELWSIAYEKLREEDDALVLDYEKKLCGDLGAGLSALVGANAMGRREQMAGILQRKMDEVNRETWKLRFGNAGDVAVKDLAEPVLGVISRANEYIAGALASNPYASMAWTGVALLLPVRQECVVPFPCSLAAIDHCLTAPPQPLGASRRTRQRPRSHLEPSFSKQDVGRTLRSALRVSNYR